MQRLAKTGIGTSYEFPIVDVDRCADRGRPAAGIQMMSATSRWSRSDISDIRTDTGAHRDLRRRLGVQRIWRAFGLQPHRVETFKLSTDPLFVDKVRDIVGLYLNPPDRALALCVDEKSQIQALDRTQPLLPMRPGQIERRSHDYQRHGTTSLFAALDIATGHVIGRCYQRHRAVEFRKFLTQVEQAVPADLDIHLVLDNYATHKAPPVKAWPARHLHFTPTSASWLNQVERWFALLAEKQIKRGAHRSVHELKAAIDAFIAHSNAAPRPFHWTKSADQTAQSPDSAKEHSLSTQVLKRTFGSEH